MSLAVATFKYEIITSAIYSDHLIRSFDDKEICWGTKKVPKLCTASGNWHMNPEGIKAQKYAAHLSGALFKLVSDADRFLCSSFFCK